MKRPLALVLGTILMQAGVVQGQANATSGAQEAVNVLGRILGALELPAVVEEARSEAVPDAVVATVLNVLRESAVPAAEAEDLLVQELEVVRAGGPVDNFGSFVQSRLAEGLRGRALAEAIRAEHRRMGVGIPESRPPRPERGTARERRNGSLPGAGAQGRGQSAGPPNGPAAGDPR